MQQTNDEDCPVLVIDQGTTSSRAIIFDKQANILSRESLALTQQYPQKGWVEQDPIEIYEKTLACCHAAIKAAGLPNNAIKGIAISNQRETTVIWHRATGKPVYQAIVWQDRRTQGFCKNLKNQGLANSIHMKTGLVIDPYFSASKIRWILTHVPGAEQLARQGDLCFGTVDTWLIWCLTNGQCHYTDVTNASRTQLFNIEQQQWDSGLLDIFDIPESLLPEVKDCHGNFGLTQAVTPGHELPILACIGDQQSALVGQACVKKGMAKSTLGTGCFLMVNTGDAIIHSTHQLLTTIAYRIQGQTHYALEGSIFNAGTVIEWLKDNLGLCEDASETASLAAQSTSDSIYFIPAFTGLGAPYWDADARGAIWGLDRATGKQDVIKAGLDAVCYQSKDLQRAMKMDGIKPALMRLDGGMTKNNWLMQRLADILGTPIQRAQMLESTALGALSLAMIELGIYKTIEDLANQWQAETTYKPSIDTAQREALYLGWQDAVSRVIKPPL